MRKPTEGKCERCGGNGIIIDPETRRCPDCNGTGNQTESQRSEMDKEGMRRIVRDYDLEEAVDMLIEHEFCVSKSEAKRVYHQLAPRVKTHDPPEESQDERIREAFEEFWNMNYGNNWGITEQEMIDAIKADAQFSFEWGHKAGFKSRDAEVERLNKKIKELLSKAEWGW